MQQREQITSREAAAILGCNVATVNRMAKDGRLPLAGKLPGLRGHNLFNRTVVELIAKDRLRSELAELATKQRRHRELVEAKSA
jgi:hypothetical protein